MARMFNNSACKVTFEDRISGTDMTMFYRLPTTSERVDYSRKVFSVSKKGLSTNEDVRVDYGMRIITGFKEGAFAKPGPDGKPVMISSAEGDQNFDPDWKNNIKVYAADILAMLARHVFEASVLPAEAAEDTEETEGKSPF